MSQKERRPLSACACLRIKLHSVEPTCFSQRGLLTPLVVSLVLLAAGLAVVQELASRALSLDTRGLISQQEELVAAAVRRSTSFMISSLSVAFAVRYNAEAGFVSGNDVAPLAGVGQDVQARIYVPPPSIIASYGLLRHENRSNYESQLQQRCGAYLNSSSLSLAAVDDPAVGVPGRGGPGQTQRSQAMRYPNKTAYVVLSDMVDMDDDPLPSCSLLGAVVDESPAHMKYIVQAAATGGTIWVQPSMRHELGGFNVGFYVAVQVRTEAAAGVYGSAHSALVSTHPNSTVWLSELCPSLNSSQCSRAGRTVTVLSVPILPVYSVEHMLDTVIQARDSIVTILHVPDALKPLIQVRVPEPGRALAAMLSTVAQVQGVPDRVYLNGSYIREATAGLQHGTLAPLVSKLTVQNVMFAGRRKRSVAGDVTVTHDPAQALADVLAYDRMPRMPAQAVQATHVFALGPHVYLYVIRNEGEEMGLSTRRTLDLTWSLGTLVACLIAAVPLLMAWRAKVAEDDYNAKLDVSQAERDGIVQAVAFAAHEIRNPLHGVLASLQAAATDMQPLNALLNRTFSVLAGALPAADGDEDVLQLYRLAEKLQGADAIRGVQNAFEDIAIAMASAEGCHRLVNDMVDYSKLQRGVIQLHPTAMVVQKTVRAAVASQRSFISSGVSLAYGLHVSVPSQLYTDELRVMQVIANGLTNASKFTSMGSITVSVACINCSRVGAEMRRAETPRNMWVAISVMDTGKGLAGIDVDALFEPVSNRHVNARNSPLAVPFGPSILPSKGCCRRRAVARVAVAEDTDGLTVSSPQIRYSRVAAHAQDSESSILSTPGIPATASALAKTRGSGLGLPVARLMARALGGDCDLYPTPAAPGDKSVGSTFLFLLPLDPLQSPREKPTPCALFGASGCLSSTARTQVRRLVHASREGLQYRFISTGSRDCAGSELSGGSFLSGVPGSPARRSAASPTSAAALSRVAGVNDEFTAGPTATPPHLILNYVAPKVGVGAAAALVAAGGSSLQTCASDPSMQRTGDVHSSGFAHTFHNNSPAKSGDAAEQGVIQTGESTPDVLPDAVTREVRSGSSRLSMYPATVISFGPAGLSSQTAFSPTLSPHQLALSPTSAAGASPWAGLRDPRRGPVLRILYAEDDATNRRLMGRMLQRVSDASRTAMEVVYCSDGWEAIVQLHEHGHLREHVLQDAQASCAEGTSLPLHGSSPVPTDRPEVGPFHLILLDLDMPRFTGDQVAALVDAERRAASHGALADPACTAAVVAVTGRVKGFELRSAITVKRTVTHLCSALQMVDTLSEPALARAGFDGLLGKPFSQESLLALCALSVPVDAGQQL